MANVQRKTLYYGRRQLIDSSNFMAMGVPGPAQLGGFAAFIHNGGFAYENVVAVTGVYTPQPAERGYARLDIKSSHGLGPVTAIGIAPDSAIFSADIALMGEGGEIDRHRISPGNPLVGCQGADFALVSIPNAIPIMQNDVATIFWDATFMPISGPLGTIGWPLRLEIWRDIPIPLRQHVRAPLFSHGILSVANAVERSMMVCVDGRRRIDIKVISLGVAATLRVDSYEAFAPQSPAANFEFLDDARIESVLINGASSQALTSNTLATFSFDGNPYTLLNFRVTGSGSGTCQIKILAWDS